MENCLPTEKISFFHEASHADIWARLKNNDQQALLALYNKHYIGLINYGIKLTKNRELTNDCITQILLRLWDKRNELPPVENVRAYLLTCLRRELFNELRLENSRIARHRALQKETDQTELPYDEYIIRLQTNKALKDKLARAMEKLTGREKELLQLKFFEDLDYDEIALQCGISKRTAYNIIHNAIKTLKTGLVTNRPSNSLLHNVFSLLAACLIIFR
jgi:RNA polymerase sigma-70 factor (ECF subfamily)